MQSSWDQPIPPLSSLVRTLDRWLSPVETTLNLVAAFGIFALMMLGIIQVITRKIIGVAIFGYIDIIELLIPIFAFLGIAYCQRLGGHVRMELTLGFFPKRFLWISEILGSLIGIFVIGVLIVYSYQHAMRAYSFGDSTMDLLWPTWPSKLLIPLAFSVLLLRLVVQFLGFVRLAISPDAPPLAVPVLETPEEQARHEIEEALGDESEQTKDNRGV